jgi:uncharacterized coiled-coil protein SlyX
MTDLKGRVTSLEITVEKLSQKVDDFITESRRTADRQDARMEKLEQSMDNTIHQIHNLVIAAIIGIVAITASVIAFVATR